MTNYRLISLLQIDKESISLTNNANYSLSYVEYIS